MHVVAVSTEIERVTDVAQRTRVALFTNSVAVGGMEEHVELLARHLDRQQFEVFVVYPHWEPTNTFFQELRSVADHTAAITPDRRHGLGQQVIETLKLMHQLRLWRIEVLHMHSTTYRGQIFACIAARLAKVQRIYVTEHLAPEHPLPFRERLVRSLFNRAVDGIVCVSEKNYEARREHTYTPEDLTIVINNGVDLNDFPAIAPETLHELRVHHSIPHDARIVGTAVRFEPEKGVDDLIAAMPAIQAAYPDSYFLMVGDGSIRAELEAQVVRIGMAERVRFVGFQSDPRPHIGLMDAFVLPVPVGSMSIGLLEAMAMERAVVITFGGKGEAVIHGESGFCAEPHDPESIAQYVIEILHNPGLQQRLGKAARQRVEQAFSAQRVAYVLGTVYRKGIRYTKGLLAST